MSRLLDRVIDIMKKHDVAPLVAESSDKYCFTAIGVSSKGPILAVKVEEELEKCNQLIARELGKVGEFMDACYLVISEKYRGRRLLEGVFYKRYGIYAISAETLETLLRGEKIPFVYASQGGVYAKLDHERMRALREKRGLSLGDLAYEVGVSRKAIYEYERGRMDASIEIAVRLEEVLKANVVKRISFKDVRKICHTPAKEVPQEKSPDAIMFRLKRALEELGFITHMFTRSPFHMASRRDRKRTDRIVARHVTTLNLDDHANKLVIDIAKVVGARVLFVTEKGEKVSDPDVVVVDKRRLSRKVVEKIVESY